MHQGRGRERHTRLVSAALVISGMTHAAVAQSLAYSKRSAINLVTSTTASQVEAGLPEEPFGKWLGSALKAAAIQWEVQVGCVDPRKQHPDDVCVSAVIPFANDLNAGVVLRVGSVQSLNAKPTVDLLFTERRDGSHFHEFESLYELAEFAQ
jgi:hypothetical protein